MSFSHTVETSASPEAIWSIWTAVGRWPEWDVELESAQLDGSFQLGAIGQLTPKVGPPSHFVISQLDPNKSYTFTTQLPLCKLKVHRFFQPNRGVDDALRFTHEVSFSGPLAFLFNALLGARFRRALPVAMQEIKRLAEIAAINPQTPSRTKLRTKRGK